VWEDRRFGFDAGIGAVGDGWAGKPRIGAAIMSGQEMAEYLIASS
jgi:predicted NAD/FAD-dependent oxidoreductase